MSNVNSRDVMIKDASEFLGISEKEARSRADSYSTSQLSPLWEKRGMDIYTKEDIYIWDLVMWNSSQGFASRAAPLTKLKKARVLDFGGGIGSFAMTLAENCGESFYYDLDGIPRNFAKFRAKKYGLKVTFVENLEDWKEQFDVVSALDVLEHVDDLDTSVRLISDSLVDGGAFYHVDNFGQQEIYPMHFNYSAIWKDIFTKYDLHIIDDHWSAKNAFFPAILHASQPHFGTGGIWGGLRSTKSDDTIVADQDKLLDTQEGRTHLFKRFVKDAKKNKWRIAIGMPIYGNPHTNLLLSLQQMWIPSPEITGKETGKDWVVEPSGLIEVSRNRIIERALEAKEPWTHLWFLDSDVVPPSPHGLYRLLLRDKDVVLGLYAFKQIPARWMIRKDYSFDSRWLPICDPREPFKFYPKYKDKLIPISGGGAGCMVIKRSVFEKVPKPWFKVDISEGTLDHTGEDIYFLEKCVKYGVQPFLDTSVVCLHMDGHTAFPTTSSLRIK
jgi:2-polyprenyl-3-methyl-5-hydroxy-6-metoxy-1,4-benzoquinol methylase